MLTTSVVEFKPEGLDEVKAVLENTDGVEVHGIEEGRALIVIDTGNKDGVDSICKELHSKSKDIISISHHSFYFEENDTGDMPSVEELTNKKRK